MTAVSTPAPPVHPTPTGERADLLETLAAHRWFLRHTVRGLSTEQATRRTTVSALTLAGTVQHVAMTEAAWADFVVHGTAALERSPEEWSREWVLAPGVGLQDVLDSYAATAARTDELVRTVDLDATHPLPAAPWFTPGAVRSARRVFLHVVAETAQHAGHADILRESLDGQKTMG